MVALLALAAGAHGDMDVLGISVAGRVMSRARNIKPGFFRNDKLAECEPLARLLFAGLWCEADREGRLEDRPRRIKVECLPYDDCDVDVLLAQLERHGFITRYVAHDIAYIQILAFQKHQNPHVREPASEIPAPDEHRASTVLAPDEHGTGPADSPFLIPDSLQPHCPAGAGRFADWWAVYPRHENRKKAEIAWKRKRLDGKADALIADVVRRKARHRPWREGIIPHPTTYLNGERWDDEIDDGAARGAEHAVTPDMRRAV